MVTRLSSTSPEHFALVVSHTLYRSFSKFSSTDAWSPAVNVYQLADRIEVAVDLAGIRRSQIDVRVEPGKLLIRGVRPAPDPPTAREQEPMRILTMEIDYGPFSRTINIPRHVNLAEVESAYREGMLWITLPLIRGSGGRDQGSERTERTT